MEEDTISDVGFRISDFKARLKFRILKSEMERGRQKKTVPITRNGCVTKQQECIKINKLFHVYKTTKLPF